MSVGNLEHAMNKRTATETTTAPAATEAAAPAKAEAKINWGSVAKDTAIIGGATVGSVVAVGVIYGVVVKVAAATYNALS